jgi:hypothetical protein
MRRTAVLGAAAAATALAVACAANTARSVATKLVVRGCGTRSAVKTLTDGRAGLVATRPKDTSVAALRRLRAPRRLTAKSARQPGPERITYRVQARMVEMVMEKDGDIRLVVLDPKTKGKLAVEFPAPRCSRAASPRNRRRMNGARSALIAACGQPTTSPTEIGGDVTLTGVGYFEPGDGADRESANGFELHPVLGFRNARCPMGASPGGA